MRAAVYTRVSTDEQGKGYSLPTQLEACRKYAAEHGHQVVALRSPAMWRGLFSHLPA